MRLISPLRPAALMQSVAPGLLPTSPWTQKTECASASNAERSPAESHPTVLAYGCGEYLDTVALASAERTDCSKSDNDRW